MLIIVASSSLIDADTPQSQAYYSTVEAIFFMVSILTMKVTAIVLGYLIVKLGHDTFIKGITGEIDFGFEGSGFSTKLKSGSPGAFFVLAGAAIIMWALFVEKTYEIERPTKDPAAQQNQKEDRDQNGKNKPALK